MIFNIKKLIVLKYNTVNNKIINMIKEETEDYLISNDNILLFKPEFNKSLINYIDIISKYDKLIFFNYNDIKIFISINNKFDDYYLYSKFNKPIYILPSNITPLNFGSNFNQEVNNLPPNLTHLTFGEYFNQEVKNLPPNLTHLTFGSNFNQEVNNLPLNITHLTFDYNFNQQAYIPFSVKYLKLNCNNKYIIDNLSNNIEELELNSSFTLELNNLPSSLKKLIFNKYSLYNKELNCLPKKLELFQLPLYYNHKIKNIPNGLKKVICSKNYKYINDFKSLEIETYKN